MKAIELIAKVDNHHRLYADVPESLPSGKVRVLVLIPDDEEAGAAWERGIALEWAAEMEDSRENIYTLEDGEPVDAAR